MVHAFPRFLLVVALLATHVRAGLREDAEAEIRRWSEDLGPTTLRHQRVELSPHLRGQVETEARSKFFRSSMDLWTISSSKGSYWALLDNCMGKVQPITFLSIVDSSGAILHSRVIKYRESIGGQVGHGRWLAQFQGRKAQSGWQVGVDVDGISGATISVVSLTAGLRRHTILLPIWLRSKEGSGT